MNTFWKEGVFIAPKIYHLFNLFCLKDRVFSVFMSRSNASYLSRKGRGKRLKLIVLRQKLQSTVQSKQTNYPLGMFEVKGSLCGSNDTFQIHLYVQTSCLKIKRSGYPVSKLQEVDMNIQQSKIWFLHTIIQCSTMSMWTRVWQLHESWYFRIIV